MADGKEPEEHLNRLPLLLLGPRLVHEPLVVKVEETLMELFQPRVLNLIDHLATPQRVALLDLCHACTVAHPTTRALEELHDVASQGASLVAEDCVDLPEVFVEVGRTSQSRGVGLLVVHLEIPRDKDHALGDLDDLERYVECDRDEVAV